MELFHPASNYRATMITSESIKIIGTAIATVDHRYDYAKNYRHALCYFDVRLDPISPDIIGHLGIVMCLDDEYYFHNNSDAGDDLLYEMSTNHQDYCKSSDDMGWITATDPMKLTDKMRKLIKSAINAHFSN